MKLAGRMTLVISVAVAIGLAGIFGAAAALLGGEVRDWEEADARNDIARAQAAMANDQARLEGSAKELVQIVALLYGGGNDTSPDNEASMALGQALFAANQLDFMAFTDASGVVQGTFSVAPNGSFGEGPASLNQTALPIGLVPGPLETRSGFLAAQEGTIMLAVHSIAFLAASAQGDFQPGHLAVGRILDGAYAASLAEDLQLDIAIEPGTAAGASVDRLNRNTIEASAPLQGADGVAVAVLVIQAPRDVWGNAAASYVYFFAGGIGIAVVLIVAALWLLRRTVTRPLTLLGNRMDDISRGAPREGLDMDGDDEVAALAQRFSRLMQRLEARERELARSNEDLKGFAAVVSHDLQSPMSTIKTDLYTLRAGLKEDARHQERLERMERTIDRMRDRIRAILAYSRADGEGSMTAVHLNTVLDSVVEDLQSGIQSSGARLLIKALPTVQGDPHAWAQVLQNLIQNALRYHKPGQRPTIEVWYEAGAVHIRDDGIGVAEDDVAGVFEAFQRGSNVAGREGQGLGLATCRRLMERLGWTLSLDGRLGRGAHFSLRPPAGQA